MTDPHSDRQPRDAVLTIAAGSKQRTIFASRACNWGALLILFGGMALMANRLRSSRLPPVAMLAVVGGLGSAALLFFGGPFVWSPLLPVLLVVLMTVVTLRVRRAEKWTEAGRAS